MLVYFFDVVSETFVEVLHVLLFLSPRRLDVQDSLVGEGHESCWGSNGLVREGSLHLDTVTSALLISILDPSCALDDNVTCLQVGSVGGVQRGWLIFCLYGRDCLLDLSMWDTARLDNYLLSSSYLTNWQWCMGGGVIEGHVDGIDCLRPFVSYNIFHLHAPSIFKLWTLVNLSTSIFVINNT